MDSLILKSFAKVNVGLKVMNRRRDGYHNIATVFQELDLYDTITIKKQSKGCKISADVKWIPVDDLNSASRAYTILKEQYPELGGVQINLQKKIPAGAGLGGGSSNAATVLKGLNKLYELMIADKKLEHLAMKVGADVPFFIRGGTQIGERRGEKLTPVDNPIKGWYLCLTPDFSISTKWAYAALKKDLKAAEKQPNFAHFIGIDFIPNKLFDNDFEEAVIPAYPEIGNYKSGLIKAGANFASLSGSGSTVFGIFDDETQAQKAASTFPPQIQTIITRPTNS
ncbi:4-(cytidine 5'-diphospho)-2-C-methyl-D-erythritol kinase [Candidatus Neomarinimicrobiota bacterium]